MADQTEKAFQKQATVFLNKKGGLKRKDMRHSKNVGLGFKTPREAIEGTYIDKKCPFTGNVSIRGRILTGVVQKMKMQRTIVIRRDYLHYLPKYNRFEKRHRNMSVHLSPCFRDVELGDIVTIGECRPLSKTIRFNVLKVTKGKGRYLGYFFSLFYFAINAGSLISTFLTPILRADVHCFGDNDCYSLAFGVPGILMVVSIVFFVAGKRLYVIKKPAGNVLGKVSTCIGHAVVKSCKSKEKREHWLDHADDKYDSNLIEDVKALLRVLVLFIPLPVFWALFDQQGSRWTFQADRMEQDIGSWTLKADQMQVLNPLLILIFIPIFEVAIYPFLTWCKLVRKPLHKMIWGGILAACAFIISGIVELNLLPTYGTPVSEGLAQLRVYNGYNCNFTLNTANLNTLEENATRDFEIGPLSAYENLHIFADDFVDLPYYLQGEPATECAGIAYSGYFNLKEKTANSFFIKKDGLYNFTDNNDKAIDGVNVRFLSNINSVVDISIENDQKNKTLLSIQSNDTSQKSIAKGVSNVTVGGFVVLSDFNFKSGAVYTINIYEDRAGVYYANTVMITPSNSIHILWLIPQYVVMTMGEVMFSVTGLEFSFTQAPASMKSVLQSVWLLTVAFGNLIVVLIVEGNFLDAQWKEFFLFAGLMLIDMLIFTTMAFRYKYKELSSSDENLAIEEIKMPEKTSQDKHEKN